MCQVGPIWQFSSSGDKGSVSSGPEAGGIVGTAMKDENRMCKAFVSSPPGGLGLLFWPSKLGACPHIYNSQFLSFFQIINDIYTVSFGVLGGAVAGKCSGYKLSSPDDRLIDYWMDRPHGTPNLFLFWFDSVSTTMIIESIRRTKPTDGRFFLLHTALIRLSSIQQFSSQQTILTN